MGIIHYDNRSIASSREHVLRYLRARREKDPTYRVIDVGGQKNPWADEFVTAYVDIVDFDTKKKKYIGDANEAAVWRKIRRDGKYDFSICTHTIEDLRDPIFVLHSLLSVSKAGYISVPNKHTEVSHAEGPSWLGYGHHRWIFSVRLHDDGSPYLFFIAKWPCIEYFNSSNIVVSGSLPASRFGDHRLRWLNQDLASHSNELGLLWEEELDYEAVDYAVSTEWQMEAYRELLKDGL